MLKQNCKTVDVTNDVTTSLFVQNWRKTQSKTTISQRKPINSENYGVGHVSSKDKPRRVHLFSVTQKVNI